MRYVKVDGGYAAADNINIRRWKLELTDDVETRINEVRSAMEAEGFEFVVAHDHKNKPKLLDCGEKSHFNILYFMKKSTWRFLTEEEMQNDLQ